MKNLRIPGGAFFHVAFFIIMLFVLISCPAKPQESSSETITRVFEEAGLRALKERIPARDFSLAIVSSGTTQSLSGFRGKVVFLNFWATWCGPCRQEMPSMDALYGKFREKGLEILAVNIMEKKADVLAFMESNKLSFPAYLDIDGTVSNSYGIQSIPTSFLIDREGKIAVRLVGSIDWDTPKIHAAIEELLNSVN